MLVPLKAERIYLGRAEDLFEFIGIRDPLARASRIDKELLCGVSFVRKIKKLDLFFKISAVGVAVSMALCEVEE